MSCQHDTLGNLAAHTWYHAAELQPLAALLDQLGYGWQFGVDILATGFPLQRVEHLLTGLAGTRAGQEIKLTAAWADVLDSIAASLPRWLALLRRWLQSRASAYRAAARQRMLALTVSFLDDWPA